ncbi:hypothetical protein ACWDTT_16045 [Streptosporangium sandarakinum]
MDKTTTSHPTMGTSIATSWRNVSGSPEHGTPVARHSVSMVESAFQAHRTQIPERLGHKGAVQAHHVYPNSPEASQTGSRVYTVPSKTGLRDFWAKRVER